MVTPRTRCLDYWKFYSDITERRLLAWNQNKHYILYIYISFVNSEISIDLPYNSTDLLPGNKHN